MDNLRIEALAVQQGINKDFLTWYLKTYHGEDLTDKHFYNAIKGYNDYRANM